LADAVSRGKPPRKCSGGRARPRSCRRSARISTISFADHPASIDKARQLGQLGTSSPPLPDPMLPDPIRIASRETDSEAAAAWRQRMQTAAAKEIYKERAAVAEHTNADLRTWRTLDRMPVRGLAKVTLHRTAQCAHLRRAALPGLGRRNLTPTRGGARPPCGVRGAGTATVSMSRDGQEAADPAGLAASRSGGQSLPAKNSCESGFPHNP